MENKKTSFVLYDEFYTCIEKLTDEQLGRLFRAVFIYHRDGKKEVDDDIEIAFNFIVNQIEVDTKKWQATFERRSKANTKNSNKKWAAKNANSYQSPPIDANRIDKVNENENEKGNDKDISLIT